MLAGNARKNAEGGMIQHGIAPFLECSSKGDIRFSAFGARLRSFHNYSIEEIYQGAKIFSDGSTGRNWKEAKGKIAINQSLCNLFYDLLWRQYIYENPELLVVIQVATGLSDIFGQLGHACQATSLWKIRDASLRIPEIKIR